jgi:D-alanyl-D-alanine dipeptidase
VNARSPALAVGLASLVAGACVRPSTTPAPAPAPAVVRASAAPPEANGLGGTLQRYERDATGDEWRPVGGRVPVVVGRTGLAWDDRFGGAPGSPIKREGDGRAPAGVFPLSTVFGFESAGSAGWVRAPYLPLAAGTECVDDVASEHYNSIVDRGAVSRVDWTSAERMRQIDQYRLGVVVDYNTPARTGRGSCIFLHVWAGPDTYTAGCTAMAERDLRDLVLWMDRARRPVLVQLTEAEHARLRDAWRIP